jgi:hypothetical protein
MKKVYTHNQVTYGAVGQKWVFKALGFEYRTTLPGGRETAERVSHVVSGALKRTGNSLDNLARANIHQIVTKA